MIGVWDKMIFDYLHSFAFRTEVFDAITIFIATTFGTVLTIGVILFLIFHRDEVGPQYTWPLIKKRVGEAGVILTSAFLSWLFVTILKSFFASPRPFITFTEIQTLFLYGTYDSFPSGHATFFAALGTALFIYHRGIGTFYLVCALLIGISRVVAGIHFPFDIIAGFILGGVTSFLVYKTLRPRVKKFLKWDR